MPKPDTAAIERVFREEYGRAVAILVRHFKDLDLAEDAVQDAFTKAVARWPTVGYSAEPCGLDRDDRAQPADRSIPTRGVAQQLAQSSTGRFEVSIVDARSSWSDGRIYV